MQFETIRPLLLKSLCEQHNLKSFCHQKLSSRHRIMTKPTQIEHKSSHYWKILPFQIAIGRRQKHIKYDIIFKRYMYLYSPNTVIYRIDRPAGVYLYNINIDNNLKYRTQLRYSEIFQGSLSRSYFMNFSTMPIKIDFHYGCVFVFLIYVILIRGEKYMISKQHCSLVRAIG